MELIVAAMDQHRSSLVDRARSSGGGEDFILDLKKELDVLENSFIIPPCK